jgi:hypothetical protein
MDDLMEGFIQLCAQGKVESPPLDKRVGGGQRGSECTRGMSHVTSSHVSCHPIFPDRRGQGAGRGGAREGPGGGPGGRRGAAAGGGGRAVLCALCAVCHVSPARCKPTVSYTINTAKPNSNALHTKHIPTHQVQPYIVGRVTPLLDDPIPATGVDAALEATESLIKVLRVSAGGTGCGRCSSLSPTRFPSPPPSLPTHSHHSTPTPQPPPTPPQTPPQSGMLRPMRKIRRHRSRRPPTSHLVV